MNQIFACAIMYIVYKIYGVHFFISMTKQTIRAYAKINMGLDITGVRSDGYHLIRTIMLEVPLYDEISVMPRADREITMESDAPDLACDETNLCVRAAKLLQKECGIPHGFHIGLKKAIPMQAGLGGGSTDAAATLKLINESEHLQLSTKRLCALGTELGADVPFCIMGGCALAEGIGERLQPLPHPHVYPLYLFKPSVAVSTKEAYALLDEHPSGNRPNIETITENILNDDLKNNFSILDNANVFESVADRMHPVLSEMKGQMREQGALAVAMSGSGSCLYAFFKDEDSMRMCDAHMMARYPDALGFMLEKES